MIPFPPQLQHPQIRANPYDLRRCCEEAGLNTLPAAEGPQLAVDIPQIRGFPRGKPFEIVVGQKPI